MSNEILVTDQCSTMKVSINFGDVRCVVPVADGQILVKDVIDLAIERYRKATFLPAEAIIRVERLKTLDGSILDLDDVLAHVVDDREQLVALFSNNSQLNLIPLYKMPHSLKSHQQKRKMLTSQLHDSEKQPLTYFHQQQLQNQSCTVAAQSQIGKVVEPSKYAMFNSQSQSKHEQASMQQSQCTQFSQDSMTLSRASIPISSSPPSPPPLPTAPHPNSQPISHIQRLHQHHQQQQQHHQQKQQRKQNGSQKHKQAIQGENYDVIHPENISQRISNDLTLEEQEYLISSQESNSFHSFVSASGNHYRTGSVSDSMLSSSNESPDLYSLPFDVNHHQKELSQRLHVMQKSVPFDALNSLVPKVSKHDDCDVVEITREQIDGFVSNSLSILHVRHGSEPTIFPAEFNKGLSRSKSTSYHREQNLHLQDDLHFNNNQISSLDYERDSSIETEDFFLLKSRGSKRWSTAAPASLRSGLQILNNDNQNAKYASSDDEEMSKSISPQSTKEEGYASEDRPGSRSLEIQEPNHTNSLVPFPQKSQPKTIPSHRKQSLQKSVPTSPTTAMFNDSTLNTMERLSKTLTPTESGNLIATNLPESPTSGSSFGRFTRGSGRLSMLANSFDWIDAAERSANRAIKNETLQKSQQNASGSNLEQPASQAFVDSSLNSLSTDELERGFTVIIDMSSSNLEEQKTPELGLRILPDVDDSSRSDLSSFPVKIKRGLLVHGVEPEGRIDRHGAIHVGDVIVEINGTCLAGSDFQTAQNIFRSALANHTLHLRVVRDLDSLASPHFVSGSDSIFQESSQNDVFLDNKKSPQPTVSMPNIASTPIRKLSTSNSGPIVSSKPSTPAVVVANTRRIGKKYHIQLTKTHAGLGFTITTRDNPAGGVSPIYIKTILPSGAAVQDGRLKPGDRLLEVCGIEMTGKSQEEAVRILRQLPLDSLVDITVSRQESEIAPSPMMPRQMGAEVTEERTTEGDFSDKDVITFQVPLNDTGSAGLGISVKGKTSTTEEGKHVDRGIFIKSVIHGGAASNDGRLRQHDQLLRIDEIPLMGKTNSEAMETLRKAMMHSQGAPKKESIKLTIARKKSNIEARSISSFVYHQNSQNAYHTSNSQHKSHHQTETEMGVSPDPPIARSVLSDTSYDMSFEQSPIPVPVSDDHFHGEMQSQNFDDSECLQSEIENTVIYNGHADLNGSSILLVKDISPDALNDSQHSLNDISTNSIFGEECFKRDGFGRQSMSEKRHAQLDAKNTDTYRRSKKSREESEKESKNDSQLNELVNYDNDDDHENRLMMQNNLLQKENIRPEVQVTPKSASKTTSNRQENRKQIFSPVCCFICQSPGSCPHQSRSDMETAPGPTTLYVKSASNIVTPFGGLRRTCSLESLQMMMQDLQKEQLEQVNDAGNIPSLIINRNATMRIVKARDSNETYRVVVNSSGEKIGVTEGSRSLLEGYEEAFCRENSHQRVNDDNYDYEYDDNISRPSTCPMNRHGGGHSMVSTVGFTQGAVSTSTMTNTTAEYGQDDGTELSNLNSSNKKKKKGLFKNFFHFRSRKTRSKSVSADSSNRYRRDESIESSNSTDLFNNSSQHMPEIENGKLQVEQEKLAEEYRKAKESKKSRIQHSSHMKNHDSLNVGGCYSFGRSNSSVPRPSTHQSMPVGQRSKVSPIKFPNKTSGEDAQYNLVVMSPRDTVGVPATMKQNSKSDSKFTYVRGNRIFPEPGLKHSQGFYASFNENKPLKHSNGRHFRGNSHDLYNRLPLDAGNHSRTSISGQQLSAHPQVHHQTQLSLHSQQSSQQQQASLYSTNPNQATQAPVYHYRQLSLRSPPSSNTTSGNQNSHHIRQMSASQQHPQQIYGTMSRPISGYYQPEGQNGFQLMNVFQNRSQPVQGIGPEALYGVVGQRRISAPQPQQPLSHLMMMRQSQPIYQSNQVQIFGYAPQQDNLGQGQQHSEHVKNNDALTQNVSNTLSGRFAVHSQSEKAQHISGRTFQYPRSDIYGNLGGSSIYQTK